MTFEETGAGGISPEAREAYQQRRQEDQKFKFSEEPQTLTCDLCGATGNAHCFGRFSFRGALPEFLCVPCIEGRAEMVRQHCLNKGVPLQYTGGLRERER